MGVAGACARARVQERQPTARRACHTVPHGADVPLRPRLLHRCRWGLAPRGRRATPRTSRSSTRGSASSGSLAPKLGGLPARASCPRLEGEQCRAERRHRARAGCSGSAQRSRRERRGLHHARARPPTRPPACCARAGPLFSLTGLLIGVHNAHTKLFSYLRVRTSISYCIKTSNNAGRLRSNNHPLHCPITPSALPKTHRCRRAITCALQMCNQRGLGSSASRHINWEPGLGRRRTARLQRQAVLAPAPAPAPPSPPPLPTPAPH